VTELDRIEGTGMRLLCEGAGGAGAETGGAICYALPMLETTMLNHAVPVADDVDLDAIEAFFTPLGARWAIGVRSDRPELGRELAVRGYENGYAWMKFTRDAEPAPPAETGLRVEEVGPDRAAALDLVLRDGFGLPSDVPVALGGAAGKPGLTWFVAFAGDEPAATGVLYVDGELGWLGGAATRPDFRRRGGQSAILAARIERARELGVRTLTTETGERADDRPSNSYRNLLRAGFREAYLRPNWLSPT
jgi:GNAT superfamily N-acetyltransferase